MAAFIQNDKLHSKSKSETVVWNKIKEKLVGRDIICYFRYPLYSSIGENKKEPDILLLDKELGIIIIEIKQFTINNIENIQDDKWEMKDYYIKYCNPKEEAEDYLYTIKSKFDKDRFLRNKIKGKYFIALPEITKLKWEEK
ncbi:MAG: NERD domain-containing protein [Romboutsia sp.]